MYGEDTCTKERVGNPEGRDYLVDLRVNGSASKWHLQFEAQPSSVYMIRTEEGGAEINRI
jgi:hypothetical protein